MRWDADIGAAIPLRAAASPLDLTARAIDRSGNGSALRFSAPNWSKLVTPTKIINDAMTLSPTAMRTRGDHSRRVVSESLRRSLMPEGNSQKGAGQVPKDESATKEFFITISKKL
jgi:hypothetical protein